jgi:hypothetical protein
LSFSSGRSSDNLCVEISSFDSCWVKEGSKQLLSVSLCVSLFVAFTVLLSLGFHFSLAAFERIA